MKPYKMSVVVVKWELGRGHTAGWLLAETGRQMGKLTSRGMDL